MVGGFCSVQERWGRSWESIQLGPRVWSIRLGVVMRQALGQARKSVKRLRSGLRKTNGVRQTVISQARPQWRVLGWAGRSGHGSEPRSAGPMARKRNSYGWAGHQCSFDTVGREWMLRAKQNQLLSPCKKVGMKALGEFGWGPVRCIYALKALTDFIMPSTKDQNLYYKHCLSHL